MEHQTSCGADWTAASDDVSEEIHRPCLGEEWAKTAARNATPVLGVSQVR